MSQTELNYCGRYRFTANNTEYSFNFDLQPSPLATSVSALATFDPLHPDGYASCEALDSNATYQGFIATALNSSWLWDDPADASSLQSLSLPLRFVSESPQDALNVTFSTKEYHERTLRSHVQTYQQLFQEDVTYLVQVQTLRQGKSIFDGHLRGVLAALGLGSEAPPERTVFLSSDIQVVKATTNTGKVTIQLDPIVREIEVQPRSLLEALAAIGGLLAILINVRYLIRWMHQKSFERHMRAFYKK